jgi:hypothetical protein
VKETWCRGTRFETRTAIPCLSVRHFSLSATTIPGWENSFVHNPPLRLVPSQSGAKEDHGRRNIRPAAICLWGRVSWNKRNWHRPIKSGWRAPNASVLLFCPRGPRHANFQRPVTGAAFDPGTVQARSCRWRGRGDSVRNYRSRRPSPLAALASRNVFGAAFRPRIRRLDLDHAPCYGVGGAVP